MTRKMTEWLSERLNLRHLLRPKIYNRPFVHMNGAADAFAHLRKSCKSTGCEEALILRIFKNPVTFLRDNVHELIHMP